MAGLATSAVGVAIVGAGIYFSTEVVSLSKKVTNSDSPNPSDFRAGNNAWTLQWVCYGLGAVALVTGGLLYFLGTPSSNPVTAVTPMIGPGWAGISTQGNF